VRHASFFSGVGGLDLGFERAGIKTVSVCEIDPYASSVLAERFPEAPNLGSITEINADDIPEADIWSGGFPCQDLSVAGKRAGFAGKRSSLAFTFLDLVEQRRPRWIVLENVPGLFSSNNGADFGRLLHEMEQLRYSVAWRTLDARYFGVAQRRRRVFIVASLEPDRAAEVLFECEGCERHPAPSRSQGEGAPSSITDGSGVIGTIIAGLSHRTGTTQDQLYVGYGKRISGAITGRFGKGVNSTVDEPLIISSSPDPDGVRETNGVAGRLDDQQVMARKTSFGQYEMTNTAATLKSSGGDVGGGSENLAMVQVYRKSSRAQTNEDSETWVKGDVANTINSFDVGDIRTTHAIVGTSYDGFNQKLEPDGAHRTLRIGRDSSDFVIAEGGIQDDPLLPDKLDGHRYRCCGNGVVAPVAEWIGRRIVSVNMLG
jgi:DNA (cytosine-5)-methyltransferase 1